MRRKSLAQPDKELNRGTVYFDLVTVWLSNILLTSFSVAIYVFLEWLFISTRPSFMSLAGWNERLFVLFVTILFASPLAVIASSLLFRLGVHIKNQKAQNRLICILPAFVLAVASLMLFDNFTYTVWKFGISTSENYIRALYAIGLIAIFVLWDFELARNLLFLQKKLVGLKSRSRWVLIGAGFVFMLAALPFLKMPKTVSVDPTDHYDNIILVSADGLNARNMSVYGYERQTTPFLDSIEDELLMSINHLPNSGNTSGAITSLLTGKYPGTTRVLYPPDILRGEDSRQHLPGILQNLGYYTAQISINHYADAKDLNFVDAFDEVNGERMRGGFSFWKAVNQRFPENGRLLMMEMEDRLGERLKHIFFIEDISNTFVQITMRSQDFGDLEKVDKTLQLLREKDVPVFVHLHWMGTHGSRFYPAHSTFSANVDRKKQEPWDKDLYDDSILDFDAGLEKLISGIKQSGEAERTLVVITADHGQGFSVGRRIPLIFWTESGFSQPNPSQNTQGLDVAPSILDHLQLPQPEWMAGQSVLDPNYVSKTVVGVGTKSTEGHGDYGWSLAADYIKAPFYQFDYISVADCGHLYSLNLEEMVWKYYTIGAYKTECKLRLEPAGIRQTVIDHLSQNGFIFDENVIPVPKRD